MNRRAIVVFSVAITEYERGWGAKPDGYIAFLTEMEADKFISKATADYTGNAPDYYVMYDKVGFHAASEAFVQRLETSASGYLYYDRHTDLMR